MILHCPRYADGGQLSGMAVAAGVAEGGDETVDTGRRRRPAPRSTLVTAIQEPDQAVRRGRGRPPHIIVVIVVQLAFGDDGREGR